MQKNYKVRSQSLQLQRMGIIEKGSLLLQNTYCNSQFFRIGLAIAKRLASDGAKAVVSSRKQKNVDAAVAELKKDGLSVTGMVCHVGLKEDRERLIENVSG